MENEEQSEDWTELGMIEYFFDEVEEDIEKLSSKNLQGKTVHPENAYEVYQWKDWTWYVLKKYKSPKGERLDEHARWFCLVKSPFVPEGEYGDCYAHEVMRQARRIR